MRKPYPSDISREAFKEIELLLLSGRKQTRPRVVDVDVYEVFCALLYFLKSGCQWSMLPRDFPPKSTVYYYFSIWNKKPSETEPSILEQALKNVVGEARISNGRKEQTSFIMIDSQSVKNTGTARDKGYDAGKKVSGIKRHIIVDTQGLPHGILVTTADKTDRQGALDAITLHRDTLQNVEVVLVDGGYTGEPFSLAVKNLIRARVEVAKRSELHKFAVIPQRWVVERSFAWLEKCRRLWKNCEKRLNTSFQFINLAFLRLLLHRKYSG